MFVMVIPGLVACPHIHCGDFFAVSRNTTMADLSCLPQSAWERKGGSGSYIAPQPATAHLQPCPPPISPVRAYEKDQLRPGGPQRGANAPPCLQMVRQKCTVERGRSLVVCGQTLRDGPVNRGKKITGSSGGKYRKCSPKSDSKRRGHHPGQKKGMRGPQMISRVSLNWLTEPQGQGAKVFAHSLGTQHLK